MSEVHWDAVRGLTRPAPSGDRILLPALWGMRPDERAGTRSGEDLVLRGVEGLAVRVRLNGDVVRLEPVNPGGR